MTLPVDPALEAHAQAFKASRAIPMAIPSTCEECGEACQSKTALSAHQREAHPAEPAFVDELREKYLVLIRNGRRPMKAAREVGISPYTVKRAMKIDPSFFEAVELAEAEYAEEIEEKLVERALVGDPWAVKEFLTKRSKARWSDDKTLNVNINGEIHHSGEIVGRLAHEQDIFELQRTVRERARLNGKELALDNHDIIDAEVID